MNINQKHETLTPKSRTVGELIEILSQYPADTPITGADRNNICNKITVQVNCLAFRLDNVGIYFWI